LIVRLFNTVSIVFSLPRASIQTKTTIQPHHNRYTMRLTTDIKWYWFGSQQSLLTPSLFPIRPRHLTHWREVSRQFWIPFTGTVWPAPPSMRKFSGGGRLRQCMPAPSLNRPPNDLTIVKSVRLKCSLIEQTTFSSMPYAGLHRVPTYGPYRH